MKDHRWERLTAAVAGGPRAEEGSRLCSACREVLSAAGTGITLVAEGHRSQLCASDEVTAMLEELQFTLGQGPSVDACVGDRPVLVAELTTDPSGGRWQAFIEPAVQAGMRAMFAFPLRVGAARLGSLTLYHEHAGPLTTDAHADGLTAAARVTEAILGMQADAPPNVLAEGLADAGANRAEVHQASGMVAVQLGIGIVDALVRLRSHAYVTERSIREVAADVVARRLRLHQ